MAIKIKTIFPVGGMSGKSRKTNDLTFYTKYQANKIFAWERTNPEDKPSEAQLAIRERFTKAAELAHADMQDPVKAKEWADKAAASKGKYLTALGCAMAYYMEHGAEPQP